MVAALRRKIIKFRLKDFVDTKTFEEDASGLAEIFRWLIARPSITLARLLKRRLVRAGFLVPPILSLPVEIIDNVGQYLSNHEKVLLSLTCSSLRFILAGYSALLSTEDWRQLLQVVQRDTPHLFYCHACVKMHPFDQTFGPTGLPACFELLDKSHCTIAGDDPTTFGGGGRRSLVSNNDYQLAFHHVQLVMNRHFFGARHGLPLSRLEVRASSTSSSGSIKTQSWRSQIIAGELFLSAIYVLSHKRNAVHQTWYDAALGRIDICPHTRTRSHWTDIRNMPALEYREENPFEPDNVLRLTDGVIEEHEASQSCSYCLTDIDIACESKSLEARVISITTYHQLGSCRSPGDWKWQVFTTPARECRKDGLPKRVSQGHRHGEVRRAWSATRC